MPHITDKMAKALLVPSERQQAITYDDEVGGFGIRVTKSGFRSFILNYHVNGRERRLTIGAFPTWSVAAARKQAIEYRRAADAGRDPLDERRIKRKELRVSELWQRYKAEVLPRKSARGQRDEQAMWEKWIVPHLGNLRLSNVYFTNVEGLHRAIGQATPVRANRIVAVLKHAFNLAIRWGLCASNPAMGVHLYSEQPRHRYLSEVELQKVLLALNGYPYRASADAIKFMLLTGCRKSEALRADWHQFDTAFRIWQKPSSHTKQKRNHRVPLSSQVTDLLQTRRRATNGDFVFPGKNGEALANVKRAWSTIRKSAGCEDVRVHDLRHTYASLLASSGTSLPIIGSMLGHTRPETTARYAHLLDETLRQAAEFVGRSIEGNEVAQDG